VGFGVSGSTAVIFLGVLIASGTLYPAVTGAREQISDAHDGKSEDLLDRRNTAIDVVSVVYDNSSNNLEINATNAGTTTLSVEDATLLVDNEYVSPDTTRVGGDSNTDVWAADQTLVFDVNDVAQPDHVTVVAGNGVTATNTTVEVVN